MTRAERFILLDILEAAAQARAALDMFELDQESGIPTAPLGTPLDRVIEGLRAVLGEKDATTHPQN